MNVVKTIFTYCANSASSFFNKVHVLLINTSNNELLDTRGKSKIGEIDKLEQRGLTLISRVLR